MHLQSIYIDAAFSVWCAKMSLGETCRYHSILGHLWYLKVKRSSLKPLPDSLSQSNIPCQFLDSQLNKAARELRSRYSGVCQLFASRHASHGMFTGNRMSTTHRRRHRLKSKPRSPDLLRCQKHPEEDKREIRVREVMVGKRA